MNLSIIIDIVTLCVAISALCFSVYCLKFTRRSISAQYRTDILSWFSQSLIVMMKLKHCSEQNLKCELLGELSALIDVGRCFFPNIVEGYEYFGKNNESGFQGLRSYMLDYLVTYYDMYSGSKPVKENDANKLHRQFASKMYEFLDIKNYINKLDDLIKESYSDMRPREKNSSTRILIEEIKKTRNLN